MSILLGAICGGHCCTNATELELRKKSTGEFERLLHHHTNSLRGILESTANLFQSEWNLKFKFKTNFRN